MNFDNFLNFEKRTGIKEQDIDDFLEKVDGVTKAISDMKEGKVKPEDVKVKGVKTEEELRQEEEAKLRQQQKRRQQEEERRVKQKQEERERWWRGAEVALAKDGEDSDDEDGGKEGKGDEDEGPMDAIRLRYDLDYSRWENWNLTDPASVEEQAILEEEKEKKEREAFEKANPEFCKEFMDDMKKRNELRERRNQSGNQLRLKGNRLFQRKQWDQARQQYMESLKQSPYVVATLNNIAQVHIKLKEWEDAKEFLNRAIYVDPAAVKALYRRAVVRWELDEKEGALQDIQEAARIAPDEVDIQSKLNEYTIEIEDTRREENVLKEAAKCKASPGVQGPPLKHSEYELTDKILEQLKDGDFTEKSPEPLFSAITGLLLSSKNARVYFRTNGGLEYLSSLLPCNADEKRYGVLTALGAAVHEENKSQLMLWKSGALDKVIEIIMNKNEDLVPEMDKMAACRLIYECFDHNRNIKFYMTVCGNHLFLKELLLLIQGAKRSDAISLQTIETASRIIQEVALKKQGCKTLNSLPELSAVRIIGKALYDLTTHGSSVCEALSGCLANLALHDENRTDFAQGYGSTPAPTLMALMATAKDRLKVQSDATKAFALAALMNACLEKSHRVREFIAGNGGIDLLLAIATEDSSKETGSNPIVKSRSIGLLSRILMQPSAQTIFVKHPTALDSTIRLLHKTCSLGSEVSGIEEEERANIVRICAISLKGLVGLGTSNLGSSLWQKIKSHDVIQTLVLMLPEPCKDTSGEVTSETVCLPPSAKVSDMIAGNIANCFISITGISDRTLVEQIVLHNGIDRLICLFSNAASDGAVRKNVGIVLARLIKFKIGDERVRELRGVEMLVKVGDALLDA